MSYLSQDGFRIVRSGSIRKFGGGKGANEAKDELVNSSTPGY